MKPSLSFVSHLRGQVPVALALVLALTLALGLCLGRVAPVPAQAHGQEIRDWSVLAAQVAPSVVQITTERDVEPTASDGRRHWNQDFRRFFRDHGFVLPFDEDQDQGRFGDDNPFSRFTPPESESGSGFIVLLRRRRATDYYQPPCRLPIPIEFLCVLPMGCGRKRLCSARDARNRFGVAPPRRV